MATVGGARGRVSVGDPGLRYFRSETVAARRRRERQWRIPIASPSTSYDGMILVCSLAAAYLIHRAAKCKCCKDYD